MEFIASLFFFPSLFTPLHPSSTRRHFNYSCSCQLSSLYLLSQAHSWTAKCTLINVEFKCFHFFFLALFHHLTSSTIPKWQNCLLKNLFKCCPPNTYMPLKLVFLDDSWEMKEKLFGRKNFSLIDFQERFFFGCLQ